MFVLRQYSRRLDNFRKCCLEIPELGAYMENGINIDPIPLTMEEFAVSGDMDGKVRFNESPLFDLANMMRSCSQQNLGTLLALPSVQELACSSSSANCCRWSRQGTRLGICRVRYAAAGMAS